MQHSDWKRQLWRSGRSWQDNIEANVDFVNWIYVDQERDVNKLVNLKFS
jgi:hypothetical protein